MNTDRRLVAVHAHPDDECLSTGGILAKYSESGVHVCLVTCTNGELGEVAPVPELGTVEEITARLAEIRTKELREACRVLGVDDVRMLGYHDSGMEGTEGNAAPHAFVNVDTTEVAERIAHILREVRPQVVVTYNEYGFYGHPDHIKAHEATVEALDVAADPSRIPDAGPPHRVEKFYHTAIPKSRLRQARELFGDDGKLMWTDEEIERIGTDDERITTTVDVGTHVSRKFDALEAHRTQLGTTERFLSLPVDVRELAMGTEHFVLARSTVEHNGAEQDLFEGVG